MVDQGQQVPGFPANVSINEHEVCALWRSQELGHQGVSGTTDQAFIGHGFHSPFNAQLTSSVGPFDKAHKSLFSELSAVTRHTDMNSAFAN
jgi:hypothetical protein